MSDKLDLTEDILDYAEIYSAQRNKTYRGCLPALYLKVGLGRLGYLRIANRPKQELGNNSDHFENDYF